MSKNENKLGDDFIECVEVCMPELMEGNYKVSWNNLILNKESDFGPARCAFFMLMEGDQIETDGMPDPKDPEAWDAPIKYKFKEDFKKEDIMNPQFEKRFRIQYDDYMEWHMK